MQIHGPSSGPFTSGVNVYLNAVNADRPFAVAEFPGGVTFHVYDDEDGDMGITAFMRAKSVLHDYRQAAANHAGLGEYVNGSVLEVNGAGHLTGNVVPDSQQQPGEDKADWISRLLTANLITVAEAEQMAGSTRP